VISQLTIAASLALSIVSGAATAATPGKEDALALLGANQKPDSYYLRCFLTKETTSGTNRICHYDCGHSEKVTTISISKMCSQYIDG
jgi:hypothetical protein